LSANIINNNRNKVFLFYPILRRSSENQKAKNCISGYRCSFCSSRA